VGRAKEGGMRDHTRVHLRNDDAVFAVDEKFDHLASLLEDSASEFMYLRDIFDNRAILIRKSDVTALSWWTEEGCRESYRFDAEQENLRKESTEPSWE